jgi:hypothetical protein
MPNPPESPAASPVRILVPSSGIGSLEAFVDGARRLSTRPFEELRVAALEALSKSLLSHPRLKRDPAGAALGFWLRRAHLAVLERTLRTVEFPGLRVPAGLVFHIAPANVDTMFIYSWGLSFLAGNANIVRLTTQTTPLMEDLLACLDALVSAHPTACVGNLFLTYEHDDAITGRLSAACDARLVWGGDETVRRLRAAPLNPHASERSFASKRSISIFCAIAFLEANLPERQRVAGLMAADIAPFGQMACSSPQAVYWIGTEAECRAAWTAFEDAFEPAMAAKLGEASLSWAVRRLNYGFDAAASGAAERLSHRPHTTQVFAAAPAGAEPADPCGAGLLHHAALGSAAELTPLLDRSHQTITYFGLPKTDVNSLAEAAGRAGVDRIVPVGSALDFGPFWDGFNLWDDLTRLVVVL